LPGCSKTATCTRYASSKASAPGSKTSRRPASRIACTAILSLLICFPALLSAQQDDKFADLDSPSAAERAAAVARLDDKDLLAHYREVLKKGESTSQVIPALTRIQRERDTDDIGLIVKYIGDLDPSIAMAATSALRVFGRDALAAVRKLDAGQVDNNTRKEVVELLLKDHIYKCCTRDNSLNPFHLSYDGRFNELYSVDEDIDSLLFRQLRDSISDIRDDISGSRYYYYYPYQSRSGTPFVDYGGLAVAALAERKPEQLMKEMGELADVDKDDSYYYYGSSSRASVTVELAAFFAHRGNTALMDKLINQMESSLRWTQGDNALGPQARIAAMQMVGLGEYEAALERLNEHLKQAGSAFTGTVSEAHYLRARILMHLKEEGAALHALEESMESSDSAMVLTLVDSTFKPLANERRYQTVLDYCRLAARRLDESQRPWEPEPDKEG